MPDLEVGEGSLRFDALASVMTDALVTMDCDGIITSWNPGAERLYGHTRAEVLGQSVMVLVPPGHADEEQALRARIVGGETVRDLDALHRAKDGTYLPVSLTAGPILDAAGMAVGIVCLARDVSARRHIARATRRLAAIVESSDDAILSKDLNGIVTSWNQAAQRMFGYTAAEMIGQSIRLLIPADRQAEEDHVLGRIRRGERVEHFETLRRRKDGGLVPISLSVSPILDEDGTVIGASKIARDISDRQQLEGERARLLTIIEQDAFITEELNKVGAVVASALDRDAVAQAVTDAATTLTGAEFGAFFYNVVDERGESFVPHTISGVSHEAFAHLSMPRNTEVFNRTFRGLGVVRSDDITVDSRYAGNPPHQGTPDGQVAVRSYLAVPVRARSGDVLGGLFFGHSKVGQFADRHERLALGIASWASIALENARLYVGVQEASRLKDEFLATLSHELRTPLNAILGYSRMIRDGVVAPERQQKVVETIERNAASLTQIVEDILDVSRIMLGKMRLNVQSVDLSTVVRNAVDAVMPAADAKGIRIETLLDPQVASIGGDPERLQQIIWNLMSNAVKFTTRGGRVEVQVRQVDSHVEIVVSDTGIGIPPAFLPYIFERFRQADAGFTRERGGLGLGLSIVRQLVELHGGTIHVTSDGDGKGSAFRIELPMFIVQAKASEGQAST